MLRFFILLIRGLIAVRWSACLKIRAGRATGLQSLALQFLSFRRGRECPRFTIVSPHSGDCGARPVTRSVSALLTRSSRRRLNGFSGVYPVENGPPPRSGVCLSGLSLQAVSILPGIRNLASLSKTLARNRKSCTGVSCFNCGGDLDGHWWHDSGYPPGRGDRVNQAAGVFQPWT
jgi:hypothetical protein